MTIHTLAEMLVKHHLIYDEFDGLVRCYCGEWEIDVGETDQLELIKAWAAHVELAIEEPDGARQQQGLGGNQQERTPRQALAFDTLRNANVQRCEAVFHKLHRWNPAEWSNAMAGEAGEACNLTKKIIRGDFPDDYAMADAVRDLAKEIADVVIYADLLAARMNIDLGEAVRDKFNEVSQRRKASVSL